MTAPVQSCQPKRAELWQERAPQGPWFVSTPHDDHIFFGGDEDSAKQCLSAISRLEERCQAYQGQVEAGANEIAALKRDLADYKQAASVEAGLRREFAGQVEAGAARIAELESCVIDIARENGRLKSTLREIEAKTDGDRATVNERNAFEHFNKLNLLLVEIRGLARSVVPSEARTAGKPL